VPGGTDDDADTPGKRSGKMPFKSKAQRRKFAELLVQGKITDETYEEWNRETGRAKLPERVRPRPGAKKRTKTRAKAKTRSSPKRPVRRPRPRKAK
jgi:hypothetical protein